MPLYSLSGCYGEEVSDADYYCEEALTNWHDFTRSEIVLITKIIGEVRF